MVIMSDDVLDGTPSPNEDTGMAEQELMYMDNMDNMDKNRSYDAFFLSRPVTRSMYVVAIIFTHSRFYVANRGNVLIHTMPLLVTPDELRINRAE